MMRTANPALNQSTFQQVGAMLAPERSMTLDGTVNKSGFLLILAVLSAGWVWMKFFNAVGTAAMPGMQADPAALMRAVSMVKTWMFVGIIGGLVLGLLTVFKKTWSPVTAPLYALVEGLFLGGFSAWMEFRFPGIVIQAVGLTFGIFFCLLLAY